MLACERYTDICDTMKAVTTEPSSIIIDENPFSATVTICPSVEPTSRYLRADPVGAIS